MKMKKVIVIGSAGAGKTTLAKQIAQRLDVSHIELDAIFHQENWTPMAKDEFKTAVLNITNQDGWVCCGNYFSSLGIGFWKNADMVVWLDYPFPLVLGRLCTRTIRRSMRKQELWNGNRESFIRNFFTRDSVILWMIKTRDKQSTRYGEIFKEKQLGKTKLVRCKRPFDAKKLLESL